MHGTESKQTHWKPLPAEGKEENGFEKKNEWRQPQQTKPLIDQIEAQLSG